MKKSVVSVFLSLFISSAAMADLYSFCFLPINNADEEVSKVVITDVKLVKAGVDNEEDLPDEEYEAFENNNGTLLLKYIKDNKLVKHGETVDEEELECASVSNDRKQLGDDLKELVNSLKEQKIKVYQTK